MKISTIVILFVLLLISGCTQVEPITSINEVEPTLVKYFGPPNDIDTMDNHTGVGLIYYRYDMNHNSITFRKANNILSRALKSEIAYTKDENRSVVSKMVLLKKGARNDYIGVYEKEENELVIWVGYYTEP